MHKLTKSLLIGAGVAATAAAASYFTTKLLVNAAVEREVPEPLRNERVQNTLTGGPFADDDVWQRIDAAAEVLRNTEHETVELIADDGVKLVGHWFGRPRSRRVIVAMHGWRSAWYRDFALSAPFWLEHGCSVLFAEQRGQNASGGDYIGFGLAERFDCRDWAEWVDDRCGGKLPIYLSGISMGATTVLMAAGEPLPKNVHGIMADCGFTSPQAILKHVSNNNLHIAYGLYGGLVELLFKQKLQRAADEYSTTEALANNTIPVLFAHGASDRFVPVEMTYENYRACAGKKRLLIVPGAEHGMSFCVEEENYKNAVLSFWKDFD